MTHTINDFMNTEKVAHNNQELIRLQERIVFITNKVQAYQAATNESEYMLELTQTASAYNAYKNNAEWLAHYEQDLAGLKEAVKEVEADNRELEADAQALYNEYMAEVVRELAEGEGFDVDQYDNTVLVLGSTYEVYIEFIGGEYSMNTVHLGRSEKQGECADDTNKVSRKTLKGVLNYINKYATH